MYPTSIATAAIAALLLHSSVPDKSSTEWIASHYETLDLVTSAPVAVDPLIAAACTTTAQPAQFSGPHAESTISIYVDNLARSALVGSSPFAPGAVIVKLKHRDAGHPHGKEAVGGMIKRHAGYNPIGGDWEYFFFEDGKLESGPLPKCVQCHDAASKRDHVFAPWLGSSTLRGNEH